MLIPKTVQGVPAHPLIIHIPVMLGPLVGLLCIVLLVVPKWRTLLAPWVAVLGVLLAISTVVAVKSGENFLAVLQLGKAIDQHEAAGKLLRTMCIVLAVLLIGFFFATRRLNPKFVTVAALIVAVGGVIETAQVVKTGHEGASLVWKDRYQEALKLQNGG
jgi:hypothetical protein